MPAKPIHHPVPSKINFFGNCILNLFVLLSEKPGVLLGIITKKELDISI